MITIADCLAAASHPFRSPLPLERALVWLPWLPSCSSLVGGESFLSFFLACTQQPLIWSYLHSHNCASFQAAPVVSKAAPDMSSSQAANQWLQAAQSEAAGSSAAHSAMAVSRTSLIFHPAYIAFRPVYLNSVRMNWRSGRSFWANSVTSCLPWKRRRGRSNLERPQSPSRRGHSPLVQHVLLWIIMRLLQRPLPVKTNERLLCVKRLLRSCVKKSSTSDAMVPMFRFFCMP